MAPTKSILDDQYLQEELALYSSLCLLEVPTGEGAKQGELSKTMFRKQNLRTFEYIIWYCYAVVRGRAAAKKHLRWPYDAKDPKQKKEFYTGATAWLKESGVLEVYGNTLEPFKRNPQGPRLVSFLLELVTYTIGVQHQQMYPDDVAPLTDTKDAQLMSRLSEPLLTAAKAQNQLLTERLLRTFAAGANLQQRAEESAGCMSDLYYSLKSKLGQAHAQAQALRTTAAGPSEASPAGIDPHHSASSSHQCQLHEMQLPEELMQQHSQLTGLWMQLEQHMQQFEELTQLVDGLTGSSVHPRAIDATKLRQCGQLPMAPSTPGLDIAAMMEAWLVDVGAVCRYIKHLAGQPESQAELGPVSCKGGHSGGVTPLLSTADASSHAPHLYAQLCLHTNCLDRLKSLKSTLGACMVTAADRIQHLEEELYSLVAVQQQECLAAMEPAALLAAQDAPLLSAPHQLKPAPTGALMHGTSASLFNNSNLPLVPPTPVLQQLVKKGTSMHQTHTAAAYSPEASKPVVRSPSSGGIVDQPSNSSMPHMPAAVAAMTNFTASPVSSVSSAAMPAAALLVSQECADELMNPEFIDLDLIDLDLEDISQPASPVISSKHDTCCGSEYDLLRMSMLQVPFGGRGAAEAALAPRQWATAEDPAASQGSTHNTRFSDDLGREETADSQIGLPGSADTAPFTDAGTDYAAASSSPETAAASTSPPHDSRRTGVEETGLVMQQQGAQCVPVHNTSAGGPVLDATDDVQSASDDGSLLPAELSGALADPMVPMSGPGSDCLSTARPRRLTFAAAVSGDARSSAAFGNQGSSCQSPASSEVSSEAPAEAASSAVEHGLQASLSLSLLRQRFAAAQQQ